MRTLWSFPGGLKLEGHKAQSTAQPIQTAPIPPRLILPLRQHIGDSAKPLVEPGQAVLKGQRIARCRGYISAPVHAPTSGTVIEIADHPIAHPSGMSNPCIVIEPDGLDAWIERKPPADFMDLTPDEIRQRIRVHGIVGMGGAGFPSAVKLNPREGHPVTTLILNGAECEPYISCDDMLMRERAQEVITGLQIMRRTLNAQTCVVGIEDNKPEAIAALRAAIDQSGYQVEVVAVPTRYPMGGEKQLIYTLTGKEVPRDGIPAHVGVVCHNPGTTYAVYKAIVEDVPLVSRIVTVTGGAVPQPSNYEVLLGTPMAFLLDHVGVDRGALDHLVMGGPMMGFAVRDLRSPVVKTSNCLMARGTDEVAAPRPAQPCIRCGACAEACPVKLLPQQLYWYSHAKDLDKAQEFELFDCIECGICTAVCPSHIPLVEYFRYTKTAIYTAEREKQASDIARRRHEFRIERQERDKRERQERLAKKKAAVSGKGSVAEAKKKAVIQAALERAKAKKAASQPRNTDDLTPDQQAKIADVDERRKGAEDMGKAAPVPSGKEAVSEEATPRP